jgi:hypothetical protein
MSTLIEVGDHTLNADGLTLPDRKFRSAWTTDGTVITIDQARLPEVKVDLCRKIDAAAEVRRLKYITPGDGMALTYREKFSQAAAVNALGEAAANALTPEQRLASYPTLAASVGIEHATFWGCAQLVLSKFAQFAALSYTIETTRLAGKKAIDAALTIESAHAAYEAIVWTV